jgi:hypothetical protein
MSVRNLLRKPIVSGIIAFVIGFVIAFGFILFSLRGRFGEDDPHGVGAFLILVVLFVGSFGVAVVSGITATLTLRKRLRERPQLP